MAISAAAAKAIAAVGQEMLKKDENGERNIKRVLLAMVAVLLVIALLVEAITVVIGIPMDALSSFLLPDTVISAREYLDSALARPIISTEEDGFLALPCTTTATSSPFGWRILRGEENWHEGLDFPVAQGTPIMSVAPGTVVAAGVDKSYGQYIKIRHEVEIDEPDEDEDEEDLEPYQGREVFYTFYAHLSAVYVFVGEAIMTHEQIALSGGDPNKHFAGNSTGAHLHIEIRTTPDYGSQVDPYDWLLKPLTAKEEEIKKRTRYIVDGRSQGMSDW